MASPTQHAHEALLAPFLQLSTQEAQREALRGLAKHLTYEHFRTLLSAKNSSVVGKLGCYCRYDIVAELPIEIIREIFLYLPLHQCFKAQRVSRTWQKLLSAPQMIEYLLRWWYPSRETDLRIPNDLSIEATLNLKAEHVDAFRTGHPFSKSILDGMPDCTYMVVYAHGFLAWIDGHRGRSIVILNVKTHRRRHLISEDRASFSTIAVSSSVIAALDQVGRCHVWDINHPAKKYLLQMPSARYDRMAASGPALAITSAQYGSSKMEIFTWSSRSMITHSFSFSLYPVQASAFLQWKIMLNPNKESLFLFQIIRSKCYHTGISRRDVYALGYTHVSFDGQIRGQGQSEWLSSMYDATAGRDDDLVMTNTADTAEVNSTATLWVSNRLFRRPGPGTYSHDTFIIRISFDFERFSFEVEERIFAGSGPYKDPRFSPLIWKDIMCWGDPADACTRIVDFKENTCEKTKLVSNLPLYRRESNIGRASEANIAPGVEEMCLGDETFFIHRGPSGWKVWCFDKNLQMANEDPGYRSLRLKNAQKHMLPEMP